MVITLIEMTSSQFVLLNGSQQDLLGRMFGTEVHTNQGLTVGVTLGPGTWILGVVGLLHAWIGRVVMGLLESVAAASAMAARQPGMAVPMLNDVSSEIGDSSEQSS